MVIAPAFAIGAIIAELFVSKFGAKDIMSGLSA
jgi:uncharacterized membrane protein YgaE (UPF0421/DUF939 family)